MHASVGASFDDSHGGHLAMRDSYAIAPYDYVEIGLGVCLVVAAVICLLIFAVVFYGGIFLGSWLEEAFS